MNLKQRTKDGPWYVHFDGPQGERLRISTKTTDHSMAQLKGLEIIREHLVDTLSDSDRAQHGNLDTLSSMLRTAYHERWKNQDSGKERRHLVAKIGREIGHWPRGAITYQRLFNHLDSLTTGKHNPKPLSNASKNRYVSCIHTACTIARRKDPTFVLPEFPHWPENNVKERYLSREEEQAILAWFASNTAPADLNRRYLGALFVLLLDSGMRCSEALEEMTAMSILRAPSGRVSVHLKHGCTKSGKGRVVPLTLRAQAAVDDILSNPLHGKWTSQNAGRQWRHVMEKLSIEGVTLHTLRHSAASRMVQAGVDLYQVMTWLGHSSMVITQRYAHFNTDSLSGALDAMEKASQANVPPQPITYPVSEAHPPSLGTQNDANRMQFN